MARAAAMERLFGQVKKSYRRLKLAKVERQMPLGHLKNLQTAVQRLGFTGSINTVELEVHLAW